ncbi:MAG TPA: ATP-dependent RecD-like DNA helicase [Xanthomonadales bacterium]|nr:ATP-dependent RecD-like DNA helicase [Xanthomonadales bacterium]
MPQQIRRPNSMSANPPSSSTSSSPGIVPLFRRAAPSAVLDPTLARSRLNVPLPVLVQTAAPSTPDAQEAQPGQVAAAVRPRARRFALNADASSDADHGDGAPAPRRAPAPQQANLAEMTGVLERVTLIGNWAIGSVLNSQSLSKTVTGEALRDLVEGNEYVFRGRIRNSERYGESLEVVSSTPHISANPQAIARFLAKNFKGIGPAKAERFVRDSMAAAKGEQAKAEALERLRLTLLNDPWSLDLSALAKNAQFNGGSDEDNAPTLLYVQRDLALRLGVIPGMREPVLKDLAKHLVAKAPSPGGPSRAKAGASIDPAITQRCWAALAKDPYAPIRAVPGYGFALADAVGKSLHIASDAPERLRALVAHALTEGCTVGGHVYLDAEQIARSIGAVDPRVNASQAIELALQAETIRQCNEFGRDRYYPDELLQTEASLAARVASMCQPSEPISDAGAEELERRVREAAKKVLGKRGEIDDSQVQALVGIMTAQVRLHTLTAGPGCGKTALMEILVDVLKDQRFAFMAPTGKAAKVLSNRLQTHGLRASTIHSALMGASPAEFRVNEDEPLDSDIVVVDESSMADLGLADGVLAATAVSAHVILLGDPDQLPSIAPGNFLRDVLRIKEVDHHRLHTTHRNQGGILDLIKQVREGRIGCEPAEGVTFSRRLGEASVEQGEIVSRYMDAVRLHGFASVALLMSKRKGDPTEPGWNTTYFNAVLRDLCNPNAEKIPGTRLHVGDRIIIRANMTVARAGQGAQMQRQQEEQNERHGWMHEEDGSGVPEERVVNGDTGAITSFVRDEKNPRNLGAKFIQIRLDDGRDIDFPGAALESITHSYAMTVHAGQGSEYRQVIAVATPGTASFINRAMLYTGLSRAAKTLHVHGDEATLKRIAATALPRRNSALVERVMVALGQDVSEVSKHAQDSGAGRRRFAALARQGGG